MLLRLRGRKRPRLRWKPPANDRAEIYLEYGPEVQIRATVSAAALLRPWFERGALPAARTERFPELLVRLRSLDGEVTVRPDVLDFVTREIERREALREEGRLLPRLDRLKLPLKIPLCPFQKRGVLFAALRQRTILADDMGLGKTAQAIGAACFLAERRGLRAALVICPASVKFQWESEVRRFSDRSAVVVEGGRRERARLYDSDVFFKIVNYEAVVRDKHLLADRDFDLVGRPILLRRRKEDVLPELPGRVQSNLHVRLTPQQLEPHESYRQTIGLILRKKVLTEMDYQRIMICLNCMRMLCDSTWLLDQETHFSTKLEEVRQLLPELVEGGRKVLVFSCWERMTQLASREMDRLRIRHVRFHGKLTLRERQVLVDEFMHDPACLVSCRPTPGAWASTSRRPRPCSTSTCRGTRPCSSSASAVPTAWGRSERSTWST